ncbi:MAG: ATP-binding protein, partial [Candidatus Omnitrophica bacterium]|nr:ATP-binding protein [Candidatus Omnitrophota bacterium]
PDPTKEENLEKTNGRGVFLIKNFMDEAKYDNNTKCLFIKKYFKK